MAWAGLVIYMTWVLINSALHLMGTRLSICLVAMLKLATPEKDLVKEVLGEEMKFDDQDNSE